MKDLMNPRYKIIALWPGSHTFSIGMVVVDLEGAEGWKLWADKYPHLFKKLEWWEDRKQEEMPEYVKINIIEKVVKPDKWFLVSDDMRWHTDNPWATMSAETCIPATEAEYLQYIKPTTNE